MSSSHCSLCHCLATVLSKLTVQRPVTTKAGDDRGADYGADYGEGYGEGYGDSYGYGEDYGHKKETYDVYHEYNNWEGWEDMGYDSRNDDDLMEEAPKINPSTVMMRTTWLKQRENHELLTQSGCLELQVCTSCLTSGQDRKSAGMTLVSPCSYAGCKERVNLMAKDIYCIDCSSTKSTTYGTPPMFCSRHLVVDHSCHCPGRRCVACMVKHRCVCGKLNCGSWFPKACSRCQKPTYCFTDARYPYPGRCKAEQKLDVCCACASKTVRYKQGEHTLPHVACLTTRVIDVLSPSSSSSPPHLHPALL